MSNLRRMFPVLLIVFIQMKLTLGITSVTELQFILQQLSAKHPVIFGHTGSQSNLMFQLVKGLSKEGQFSLTSDHSRIEEFRHQLAEQSGLWLESNHNHNIDKMFGFFARNSSHLVPRIGSYRPFVTFLSDNDIESISDLELEVDQNVCFINVQGLQLYESYILGGQKKVFHQLGSFFQGRNNLSFITNEDLPMRIRKDPLNFLERRSNFHGLSLKVMTDYFIPFIVLEDGYRDDRRVSTEIPDTYEVM